MRRAGRIAIDVASRLAAAILRLRRDQRGSIAIFLGLAVIPLIGAIGIGVDTARGFLVRSRLSQALDAAALAGGRVMFETYRDDDVRMYFASNFPNGYLGATVSVPVITEDAKKENLTVSAQATLPSTFMRIFGAETITVRASTTINRTNRGMELVLVMDNTGSMAGARMTNMKAAATDLVNILYGEDETLPNFWVGLVPYVAVVNIGTNHADWTTIPNYPSIAITSMTRSNANSGVSNPSTYTVCVTTQSAHGFTDGLIVDIQGASQTAYNGRHVIRTTANTTQCGTNSTSKFWYVIDTNPATPATAASGQQLTVKRPTVDYSPGTWKGCVEARVGVNEETDAEAPPSSGLWNRSFWPSTAGMKFYDTNKARRNFSGSGTQPPIRGDNNWGTSVTPNIREAYQSGNDAYGPNLGCGPAITPLQASKTTALNAISQMQAWSRGGTMANLGLAWGWRVLSPNYRGLWGSPAPATSPLDYNQALIDKVVVLLTDGENQWYDYPDVSTGLSNNAPPGCGGLSNCAPGDGDYTAYGRLSEQRLGAGINTNGTANPEINARMTALCTAMKAKNIIIYTIVVEVAGTNITNLYQGCASKPEYYFNAPTSAELQGIFKKIATQLSNLRLSR